MRSDTERPNTIAFIGLSKDGVFAITAITRELLKTDKIVLMNMRKEIIL